MPSRPPTGGLCRSGTLLGASLLWAAAAAQAAEPVTVCMAADNPPLSHQQQGQARGLDVRIAAAAAARLGRPLKVVLFESEFEKESTLSHEVNALLSSGVCEAASGFPLLASDLGPTSRPSARTPDYPGAKRRRERPYVPLGELVASRAYQSAALGLVRRAAQAPATATATGAVGGTPAPVDTLVSVAADGGQKIGVTTGTLAGTVAMTWRFGQLKSRLVSVHQREDLLAQLAKPDASFQWALVPLALFDGWRLTHPQARLEASSWRRPIGVNLGFVTLKAQAEVREAINQVIEQALADQSLVRWGTEEGVSWSAPTPPDVGTGPSLSSLAAD